MDDLPSPGERLLAWMRAHNVSHATLGKALGKSHAAVYGWTSGDYRPEAFVRQKLDRFTAGAIASDVWLTAAERAELESMLPHGCGVAA